jgi:shikimate dehydrogenase
MKRLGVLGWPVAHSRSPAMHMAAFAALDMDGWRYQRLPVPPALFAETLRALPGAGFVGASVTIPHKQAALALADHASASARRIGAANTLSFSEDGAIEAQNTDAPGLVAALADVLDAGEAKPSLPELSVLVLGAGGSARAAVWGLREAGVRELALWNRTRARAEDVARELGGRVLGEPEPADVLINCTSVGLEGAAGAICESDALAQLGLTLERLRGYSYVVDLVYGANETPLLAAARKLGAQTLDGIEVLVRQGALSFELWTSVAAPLDAMRGGARGQKQAPAAS